MSYLGRKMRQSRCEHPNDAHLVGRVGTVVEEFTDEKGNVHVKTAEDRVWCPVSLMETPCPYCDGPMVQNPDGPSCQRYRCQVAEAAVEEARMTDTEFEAMLEAERKLNPIYDHSLSLDEPEVRLRGKVELRNVELHRDRLSFEVFVGDVHVGLGDLWLHPDDWGVGGSGPWIEGWDDRVVDEVDRLAKAKFEELKS